MNYILDIMKNRRSVRDYNEKPISETVLNQVLESGLLALTGRNSKSTRFLVIKDKEKLKSVSKLRKGAASMLEKADCGIIVLSDSDKTDLWIEDGSIAAAYMHLTADALGLGSCWIQIRDRKDEHQHLISNAIKDLFKIPNNIEPICILSLGNIDHHLSPKSLTKEDFNRVKYENWE